MSSPAATQKTTTCPLLLHPLPRSHPDLHLHLAINCFSCRLGKSHIKAVSRTSGERCVLQPDTARQSLQLPEDLPPLYTALARGTTELQPPQSRSSAPDPREGTAAGPTGGHKLLKIMRSLREAFSE